MNKCSYDVCNLPASLAKGVNKSKTFMGRFPSKTSLFKVGLSFLIWIRTSAGSLDDRLYLVIIIHYYLYEIRLSKCLFTDFIEQNPIRGVRLDVSGWSNVCRGTRSLTTGHITAFMLIVIKRWARFIFGMLVFNRLINWAWPDPSIIWGSCLPMLLMNTERSSMCGFLSHVLIWFFLLLFFAFHEVLIDIKVFRLVFSGF